jgi:hypothetical protein
VTDTEGLCNNEILIMRLIAQGREAPVPMLFDD